MEKKSKIINKRIIFILIGILLLCLGLLLYTTFAESKSEGAKSNIESCTLNIKAHLELINSEKYKEEALVEKNLSFITGTSENKFELPLSNSMGINIVATSVKSEPSASSETLKELKIGSYFLIKEEANADWLKVESDGQEGYIESILVMVNLPDIIPSIKYNISNSSSSVFTTSGKDLPGVTGENFYHAYHYNERLGKEEYVAPVLYPMAEKLQLAQAKALSEGNTLILYETYRPYSLQRLVVNTMSEMMSADETVKEGVSKAPWSMSWFISNGVSNHQRALAIDVTLGKVNSYKVGAAYGEYYYDIDDYTEFEMQTPMHELSTDSVSMDYPVSFTNANNLNLAVGSKMTDSSIDMRRYLVESELRPIASEWWHFEDLENISKLDSKGYSLTNSLTFTECISEEPDNI